MKKFIPALVVIMIATLALAACGGGSPTTAPEATRIPVEEKPAAQPTQPPAQQPAAVDSPTAEPDTLQLSNVTAGLGSLDSYKASFSMTFEGQENGQPKSSTLSFTEEFVKDPPAKRTVITGFGAMLGGGTETPASDQSSGIESIEVGGKQYSKMGEICSQVTAESGPQANTMLDPDSIIGGVRGARRVGNETVNGVPAVHYKLDVSGLETLGYLNGDGDVWVAEPGNFVVKYTFQATGSDKFFGGSSTTEGTIKWVYEVTDVNQPINIQPPANCGGAAEDIPMMADAQDQAAFGAMSTYSTPSKFEDVVAFYEKEMKAKGWSESEGGMSTEGMSMKTYTKDGRTVQVVITADSSGGKTSVMITEEKK
jgi:predicted small lipoprotein YifL